MAVFGSVNGCVSSMHLHVYLGISGSKKDMENQLVEYIANAVGEITVGHRTIV